jgi:GGDEF domain-containing protein
VTQTPDSLPSIKDDVEAVPSALHTLEPVIRELLSGLRGAAGAAQAVLLFGDPALEDKMRVLMESTSTSEEQPVAIVRLPPAATLEEDFPEEPLTVVELPEQYGDLWISSGAAPPDKALWLPLRQEDHYIGGILLSGGDATRKMSATSKVEVKTASDHLGSLLSQVIRLERDNVKLAELINMLRATRTLMRESEAGHLVNMTLSTLSRIVGNGRLALFPTTVLGRYQSYLRHVDAEEAADLHQLMLERLDPRADEKVNGRQAWVDASETFADFRFGSFTRTTPWVLRDSGRTYLGMLYLFDNDAAQEDTLTHAVVRTIVVELERTLRRYLIEDDAAHAVSDLPYRIWSREYWLRRFEEEINLTGRRGTRVTCGILELLDYDRLLSELDELILNENILTFLQVVKASVRETDLICRLDRNHFGILFLDAAKEKVLPAVNRIASRLQQVVGGAAMAPRVSFAGGLSEFPWDGESVPTLLRRAWSAAALARSKGHFTVEMYDQDAAEAFMREEEGARNEIDVHLELLGNLVLPASAEFFPPSSMEER